MARLSRQCKGCQKVSYQVTKDSKRLCPRCRTQGPKKEGFKFGKLTPEQEIERSIYMFITANELRYARLP